ncbi:MAG TPA: hypothetical protein VGN97_21885 [Mesorhizobium sp.]|jgi:hypothetical protein|nr:hypothetical protein [Mesorhizobium sp.]
MTKFATFDQAGLPLGFYTEDIHGEAIPDEAVKITDQQWKAFLNNPGRRRWDGTHVVPYEPPAEPDPVPAAITPLQARNGLRAWGIGKQQIAAFLAAIPDEMEREAAEDAWEYATSIERSNPLIAACAAFLGKTEEEVDQFFRDAAAS